METETKQNQEEIERKNKLSVEVADIINSFPDIIELKNKLTELKSLSKQTVDVLVDTSVKQKNLQQWTHELNNAIRNGVFPSHCERSAFNWGCCAVGARIQIEDPEFAKRMAESDDAGHKIKGRHLTNKANELGKRFYSAVRFDRPTEAKRLFDEIQSLPRIFMTDEEWKQKTKTIKYRLRHMF